MAVDEEVEIVVVGSVVVMRECYLIHAVKSAVDMEIFPPCSGNGIGVKSTRAVVYADVKNSVADDVRCGSTRCVVTGILATAI